MTNDYTHDITPRPGGPLLAPNRPAFRPGAAGHVNAVDWTAAPIAKAYGVTGETKGGPRRKFARVA